MITVSIQLLDFMDALGPPGGEVDIALVVAPRFQERLGSDDEFERLQSQTPEKPGGTLELS